MYYIQHSCIFYIKYLIFQKPFSSTRLIFKIKLVLNTVIFFWINFTIMGHEGFNKLESIRTLLSIYIPAKTFLLNGGQVLRIYNVIKIRYSTVLMCQVILQWTTILLFGVFFYCFGFTISFAWRSILYKYIIWPMVITDNINIILIDSQVGN